MYFFNLWQVKKVKKVFSTFPDARTRSHLLQPLPISLPSLQEGRALVVTTSSILLPTSSGQRYPVSAEDLAASAELEISKRDIKKGLTSSLQTLALRTALLV